MAARTKYDRRYVIIMQKRVYKTGLFRFRPDDLYICEMADTKHYTGVCIDEIDDCAYPFGIQDQGQLYSPRFGLTKRDIE